MNRTKKTFKSCSNSTKRFASVHEDRCVDALDARPPTRSLVGYPSRSTRKTKRLRWKKVRGCLHGGHGGGDDTRRGDEEQGRGEGWTWRSWTPWGAGSSLRETWYASPFLPSPHPLPPPSSSAALFSFSLRSLLRDSLLKPWSFCTSISTRSSLAPRFQGSATLNNVPRTRLCLPPPLPLYIRTYRYSVTSGYYAGAADAASLNFAEGDDTDKKTG